MSAFYCDYAIGDPVHGAYHDEEYGFPQQDEAILMERLALEIMQAGLNWGLVLKKRPALVEAFDGFKVDLVAAYQDDKRQALLNNPAIIRNRLKIDAIIHNAKSVQSLRDSHGGFAAWLAAHHPLPKAAWVKLFKKQFKFTGGEITGEFLLSLGYLPNTHREDCPTYARIMALNPPWASVDSSIYC